MLLLNPDGTVKGSQKISELAGNFTPVNNVFTLSNFGSSAAGLGDVDGDGVPDLAVGTPVDGDGGINNGAVYVLFLNPDGTVKGLQKISELAGNFTPGNSGGILDIGDQFGGSAAGIGDIDGDGVPDLAVGARNDGDGGAFTGAVYVLFLNPDGTVKGSQKISELAGNLTPGNSGGVLDDEDNFGFSAAVLGDVDGDGVTDLAVGATLDDDGGTQTGAVYVLFLDGVPSNQAPDCSNAAIVDQSADANCGATISGADVTGVTDPDNDPLTITVSPATLVLGANTVTVDADDGNGGVSSCDITVNLVDDTPPVVTADLISVPGDDDDEEEEEKKDDDEDNLFAVQCSATDNCDANPGFTSVMQAPSLTDPEIEFKVKDKKKLKFDLKKNEVKVEGPDPEAFWAEVQNAGGVAVNDGQVLKLKTTGGDKHEFKFDKDGNLKEVKGQEAPTLVCSATDAAGNVSTETVSAVLPPDSDSDGDGDDEEDKAHKSSANTLSSGNLPSEFALAQNHPNPFNPTTTITFAVPEAGEVTLAIYNLRGQLIQTLHSGVIAAGQHSVVWNGTDFRGAKVASGIYVYQLKAKNFLATKKLVLTK